MKFTCLSEGNGYNFPPCHILTVNGFRVLFDYPLDLSALTVFSPIPINPINDPHSKLEKEQSNRTNKKQKIEKPLDQNDLILSEPYYKTVKNPQLLNIPFIDVILISSPMGMLGLPFLTRHKDFTAKIYVTEAAARLGQLMMEDLITMHKELKQYYGPEDSPFPPWMKWEELEKLHPDIKSIVLGQDGIQIGSFQPLYSAADVKNCMQKIESLKYGEEICYNGTLLVKGFSSGLEIGSCNWSINTPKGNIAYLSSSIFGSKIAMDFDFKALQNHDVFIYSDINTTDDDSSISDDITSSSDEHIKENEKLTFLASYCLESVKSGGSTLISIGRFGIIFQLLELIANNLQNSNLKVPIFIVSSIAEELLAFSNIIPEWLSKERQDQLYKCKPLFTHVELIKEKKLHVFPNIYSRELLKMWQEQPCIVFCPHWSLRVGPAVHFLKRWCKDPNSLLIMEEGVDGNLALLPFKPMAMKVIQCSFLSGLRLEKLQPLMKILQPKYVLFPDKMKQMINNLNNSFSLNYFSKNQTFKIPKLNHITNLKISIELASKLHCIELKNKDTNIARLKGELLIENGQHYLILGNEEVMSSQSRPFLQFGKVDLNLLVSELNKLGVKAQLEENSIVLLDCGSRKGVIEVMENETIVKCGDEDLCSLISEAIRNILNVI